MTVKTQPTDIAVRQLGAITIVEFLDRRLIDTARIQAIGTQLKQLINATPGIRLLLNFEKVEYLSSTMLNELIAIEKAIQQKNGRVALANLHSELQKVFTMMKLHKIMKICRSTDEAMSALAD